MVVDDSNNIYLSGVTHSHDGIATAGAYNDSFGYGFLAKFDPFGILLWATYYELTIGVAVDPMDNIYLTGYTKSKTGIATSGAYQTSLTGIRNAYLAKFNSSGSLI